MCVYTCVLGPLPQLLVDYLLGDAAKQRSLLISTLQTAIQTKRQEFRSYKEHQVSLYISSLYPLSNYALSRLILAHSLLRHCGRFIQPLAFFLFCVLCTHVCHMCGVCDLSCMVYVSQEQEFQTHKGQINLEAYTAFVSGICCDELVDEHELKALEQVTFFYSIEPS